MSAVPGSPFELAIVVVIVAACVAFIILRIVRLARGRRPSCCAPGSGGARKQTRP